MNSFVYDTPTKVYFGEGQLSHLGEELKKYGNTVLLTYGGGSIKKSGLYGEVVAEIKKAGLKLYELSDIAPNPRIESVRKGVQMCKDYGVDVLLAVGGGSTIDATKIIAAGACVDFDPWLFLSEGAPIEKALPIVTVLTLSATGSEMDTAAVISNPATNQKIGRSSRQYLPKASFLNPALTYTVSKYQTACGSADIMSHIMEVYFNLQPGFYMLDCFMEGLLKTVIKYTPVALKEPCNYEARANLMWASSWAINGFIKGGRNIDWSCHPIEHELSAYYDITHGLGLAIITPKFLRYCLDETTAQKIKNFAVNVFDVDANLPAMQAAEEGISALENFFYVTCGLTSNLTDLGITDEYFEKMAQSACCGNVIKGFKTLSPCDVQIILRNCL